MEEEQEQKDFEQQGVNLREWLSTLPCVKRSLVVVDVRGPWPVAMIGMRTRSIENMMDMIDFISLNLD